LSVFTKVCRFSPAAGGSPAGAVRRLSPSNQRLADLRPDWHGSCYAILDQIEAERGCRGSARVL